MANTPKSFEEFYHSLKKVMFGIDVVIDYAEEHEGELGEYEGNMLCPECKQNCFLYTSLLLSGLI